MTGAATRRELHELARLCGVQLSYSAQSGKQVRASTESLLAVLSALGHPVEDAESISAELKAVREQDDRTLLEPVIVLRTDGTLSSAIPGLESDDHRVEVDGGAWTTELAPGYHRVRVQTKHGTDEALLLVPPRPAAPPQRQLAVTTPLYSVRGFDDWGVGSFTDLLHVTDLAASWGARLVGSLPLFAGFLHPPIDPSPYLPVSRIFWNELYLDVAAAAELAGSDKAREAVTAARPDRAKLRSRDAVDYEAAAHAKRRALEACAASVADGSPRDAFEDFVAGHPELVQYADFRAAGERLGASWRSWSSAPGAVPEGTVDPDIARYHRFVQYAAAVQLAEVADLGAARLYLDLPVGVHPDGYDTWSNAELFADAQVGSPPDAFFSGGQAWGFAPLDPHRLRRSGYSYFVRALRHVLRYAGAIRIDHILALQRLYWIPAGADARDGVYVRYPDEELRAIIAIESHRAGAVVVGEDLGTVSPDIRRAMDRDGILGSFVYQFEATPADPLPQPTRPCAVSVSTHDLPRFAAFWRDPEQRDLVAALGVDDPATALHECLHSLASGPANVVVVDIADLEGETRPDNRPGTGPDAGNWRRRLTRPIDELAADRSLRTFMTDLAEARNPGIKEVAKR